MALRSDAPRTTWPGWLALDSMRPPRIGSHLSGQMVAWLNAEEASAVLSAYVLIEAEGDAGDRCAGSTPP